MPRRSSTRAAATIDTAVAEEVTTSESLALQDSIVAKKTRPRRKSAVEHDDVAETTDSPKSRRSKKRKREVTSAVVADDEVDPTVVEHNHLDDAQPRTPKKNRKPPKPREPKPEPVYVIPDVETRPTTFKGRLGYACLNTILRNKKPAKDAVFCSRTCRIATMQEHGVEFAKELGQRNARDLLELVEWNETNRIRFMRVSSEMFPFASHKVWGYSLEYARAELEAVGKKAREYGHRLTTHPGQFTQLGSPREEVTENAIRDLEYHCDMLDMIGLGPDSVMIIHGGGTYGDKQAALERLKHSIKYRLPARVRARLVLENDEICFSAEDLLPLCEELDIPLVFDYHHDWLLPSSIPPAEIIARANAIFARRGIRPKQHLSSPRPGATTLMEKRAHADRCDALPDHLPDDVDLMIEAKDKEQAVLHLYRIYQLEPVIHASLRPPAEHQTLQTKGRKSPRKRKVTDIVEDEDVADQDEDANPGDEDLTDPEVAVVHASADTVMGDVKVAQPEKIASRTRAGRRKRSTNAL